MSDTANKESITVCNYQTMATSYSSLCEIAESLLDAYNKAVNLAVDFTESYEGEAATQVVLFLESLPQHLYKLQLFYGKMAQYVAVASASFSMNDETIAEKMGK